MVGYEPDTERYIDITIEPVWSNIPLTRNFIEGYLLADTRIKTDVSKMVMTASELLENAVKYSNDDKIVIRIVTHEECGEVDVSVINSSLKKDFEIVKAVVDEANSADDTFLFFIAKLQESHAKNKPSAGLGLPRIRHETGGKIKITYTEKDTSAGILEVSMSFKSK